MNCSEAGTSIKHFSVIAWIVLLAASPRSLAHSIETLPRAKKLLGAPTILVGHVEALHHTGREVLRPNSIPVNVFNASISVRYIIRGDEHGEGIVVRRLLKAVNPFTSIDRQELRQGKYYVFFLSAGTDAGEFAPFHPGFFALDTVEQAGLKQEDEAPMEALRRIAKLSIENVARAQVGMRLAAVEYTTLVAMDKWFDVLAVLYDREKDLEFLLRMTEDASPYAPGNALALLCERDPEHPSLYAKAMIYVKDTSGTGNLGSYHRSISKSLPAVVGEEKLTRDELKKWLSIEVRNLQEVALAIVKERRDRSMSDAVVRLMRRAKNRRIQYNCIRALCAMWGKRGPGYRTFVANRDQYINEFASLAVGSNLDLRPPEGTGKAPARPESRSSTKQPRPQSDSDAEPSRGEGMPEIAARPEDKASTKQPHRQSDTEAEKSRVETMPEIPAPPIAMAGIIQARPVPGRSAWALVAGIVCFLLAGAVLFSGAYFFYFGWKKRARTAG